MNLKSEYIDDDSIRIYVFGEIDAVTSESFRKGFNEITDNAKNIVLDFKNVKYVSSAGLRELLICKKKHENLRIENLSEFIYKIFLTTGFDKIIPLTVAKDEKFVTDANKFFDLKQNKSSVYISFNEFLEHLTVNSSLKSAIVYDGKGYSWTDIDKMASAAALKLLKKMSLLKVI